MRPRLLLFDIGDVLVKPSGAYVVQRFSKKPLSIGDIRGTWLSVPAVQAFETGQIDATTWAEALSQFYDFDATPSEFIDAFRASAEHKFPGVDDYLAQLKENYQLACLSNTIPIQRPRIGGEFGLGEAFHRHYLSFEIGFMKPDDRAFRVVTEDTGIDPAEILFIDDRLTNHDAALRLGFRSVHVEDFEDAIEKINAELT